MARRPANYNTARQPVAVDQLPIMGRPLIKLLERQLARLRHADAHGNRVLHADQVVVAHLIAFFNPVVESLRIVESVFEQPRARRLFKLPEIRRSTLADAQRVFDPALLQPLVADLLGRLQRQPRAAARLDDLTRRIVAVDATFFEVAGRILWALPHNRTSRRGSVQMCLHFDVCDGVPVGFTLLPGSAHEGPELRRNIQGNTLYLLDRGYQSYRALDAVVAADSDFVVRLRQSANFAPLDKRPLTVADRSVGVQYDWLVQPSDRRQAFATPMRLVEIQLPEAAESVRLLTNRLDLAAAEIGLLYRHRWQIELFFRWLKCVVQVRHFMSESPEGMTLQLYVALIGTLLIALETGAPPNKYDYALWCLMVCGALTPREAREAMDRRRAERQRAAAWQRQYNAGKKAAH